MNYPGLEGHPQHALLKRQMSGATAATVNNALSRALSDRPIARWLQRMTGLVLVAKLEKPAS